MRPAQVQDNMPELPAVARRLGFAGLLPQALLVALVLSGNPEFSEPAIHLALAYSALILSFLGGTWWGLAAGSKDPARFWIWLAAVTPSLIAFAALGAVLSGQAPQLGLCIVGGSLIAALGVDYRLVKGGLCPSGWLALRIPLSLGLGSLTILIAILSR